MFLTSEPLKIHEKNQAEIDVYLQRVGTFIASRTPADIRNHGRFFTTIYTNVVDLTNRRVSLSFSDFDWFMEKITLRLPEKRIQSERLFIFPFL